VNRGRANLKILSTRLGGSRVWTAGNGPTVVVVHGGPGFDHWYLTPPLLPLAKHFRLVFYDQRSRGAITPAGLTEQLRRILAAVASEGPPVVLAHSWGTYLAFACLTLPNAPAVGGAALVSPVPLTLKGFTRAGARFQKSLPKPAPTSIKELFPYYLAKQNRGKESIPMPHFDAAAYRRIMTALQGSSYDFRKASALLPKATSRSRRTSKGYPAGSHSPMFLVPPTSRSPSSRRCSGASSSERSKINSHAERHQTWRWGGKAEPSMFCVPTFLASCL
jgi:pimeloyl-ACP methyl ester carboxylesterase